MSQILDLFKHLVRDILFYLISGLLLIGNFILIYYHYFDKSIFVYLKEIDYLPLLAIIASYGIGQIIMGFMFLAIESTGVERVIARVMKINPDLNLKGELFIYINNKDIYEYYIERYNQLYYLRWNVAGACLIISIINFLFLIFRGYNVEIFIASIVPFLVFISLLLLHYKTGEEYNFRIKVIQEILYSKEEKTGNNEVI